MDFMEFINTPAGAISMLMLGVLIICIWAVIHFSYLYKKEKSAVVKWFNATHAVLTFINDKNIKIYGGVIPNRAWRKSERNTLREYWYITDANSLNELGTTAELCPCFHQAMYVLTSASRRHSIAHLRLQR